MKTKLKRSYPREQVIVWLQDRFPQIDWTPVEAELPPLVWRHRWNRLAEKYGLPYTRQYIEKLDSKGEGPSSVKFQ